MFTHPVALRVYPPDFGKKLVEVYQQADQHEDRTDLRKHYAVDPRLTDRENFMAYPLGDLWLDAELLDVVEYVYQYCGLHIPDSWAETMEEFMAEVRYIASQL